jgi:hypothetical protein
VITAAISGDDLLVCTWDTFADTGQLTLALCGEPRVPTTMPGGDAPSPTRIDITRISTLLYEGDYVTAEWLAGGVTLRLWRVGPKEP